MNRTIPAPAAALLTFIYGYESRKDYDMVYGGSKNKKLMPKPITSMTIDEVIADGPRRTKLFGSSACGAVQFMTATLKQLKYDLGLKGTEKMTGDFQDGLGYELLRKRGYDAFMYRKISVADFAKAIAQEWASMPVLVRCKGGSRTVEPGQSFYAGDALNKALVSANIFEDELNEVLHMADGVKITPHATGKTVVKTVATTVAAPAAAFMAAPTDTVNAVVSLTDTVRPLVDYVKEAFANGPAYGYGVLAMVAGAAVLTVLWKRHTASATADAAEATPATE